MTSLDDLSVPHDDETAGAPSPPGDFERPGGLLSRVDGHVVLYHDPHCPQAEQYRACRTNLTALNRHGASWAVAVTSSRKGEGKSITAANLAASLAEQPGIRVCLVDTDARSHQQDRLFGIEARAGMTELLLGEVSLKDVLHPTVVPNLDLLPCGEVTENPAELLGSARFKAVVDELKRRYSWILLDTPPVHPYTDACVVAAQVDGALLVVRLQDTPRELVNRALDGLLTAGGRVLGTFLTGLAKDRDDELYGYYGYGEGEVVLVDEVDDEDSKTRLKERKRRERELRAKEQAWIRQRLREEDRDDDAPV